MAATRVVTRLQDQDDYTGAAVVGLPFNCELVKPSGLKTRFVATADTSAARTTAFLAAITAAASGDKVHVGPGALSNVTNFAKTGVNIHFQDTILSGNATADPFIDDGGSALSMVITGSARFTVGNTGSGSRKGTFNVTHASSIVIVQCDTLTMTGSHRVGVKAPLNVTAGYFSITGRTLTSNYWGGWWDNGECYVNNFEKIVSPTGFGVASPVGTMTGSLWVRNCGHIVVETLIEDQGLNSDSRVWFQGIGEIEGNITVTSVRGYSDCQKHISDQPLNGTGGSWWHEPNKLTSTSGSWILNQGATFDVVCAQYEDSGMDTGSGDWAGAGIATTGGTTHIHGGRAAAGPGDGVLNNGGTTNLQGFKKDAAIAGVDLNNASGTLYADLATPYTTHTGTITGALCPTDRLGTGTADNTTFLRGDQTWATPPAGFTNPMSAVGDVIYGATAGAATRLAGNTTGFPRVLLSTGTGSAAQAPAWSTVDLTTGVIVGALGVSNGGTGQSSITVGDILYGGSPNVINRLGGNTLAARRFLQQTGDGSVSAAPTWTALVAGDIPSLAASIITSGTLAVAQGGTNIASYAVGDLIYASGSTTLSKLADVATGSVLISGGVTTAPAWSTAPTISGANITTISASNVSSGTLATARMTANLIIDRIVCSIDNGGSVLTTGLQRVRTVVPFAMTITKATLIANESGSIVVDVRKSTYSSFPTTASICASAKPTITTAQKSQDSTLTGWTTSVAAGDVLEFNINSVTTVTGISLILEGNRT